MTAKRDIAELLQQGDLELLLRQQEGDVIEKIREIFEKEKKIGEKTNE